MIRSLLLMFLILLSNAGALSALDLKPSELLPPAAITLAQQEDKTGFVEVEKLLPEERGGLKNPWQAFAMSLLVPGGGQRYVGSGFKSKVFFFAEIALWSTFLSFRQLGGWRKDDYKLLAQADAGTDLTGKDDEFYDLLGFYDSREDYNKIGRVGDRHRPYYPDNSYYFWKWNSTASRLRYRELKNDSRSFYRNANFALGLLIANHALSAADAFLAAKRHNRRRQSGFSAINLQLRPEGGFMITLVAGI
ncbi:MAG: hypothetical protein KAT58_06675 [candidate division Zixibacteria bacterium]|nr:hypothetical protein [candidate division Zixibacteria bacterium]